MTASGFKKAGWTWTAKGWKKTPRRLPHIKLSPMPRKNRLKKVRRIPPPAANAEAPQIAKEQGRAVSAPILPAPETAKPAMRQTRKAWGEKYDQLNPQQPEST